MDPSEIFDFNTFREWLAAQSDQVGIVLTLRSAMRLAPLYWSQVTPVVDSSDSSAFPVLRRLLLAGVATARPLDEIIGAARNAVIPQSLVRQTDVAPRQAQEPRNLIDLGRPERSVENHDLPSSSVDHALMLAAVGNNAASIAIAIAARAISVSHGAGGSIGLVDRGYWEQIRQDALAFDGLIETPAVFSAPLWQHDGIPAWVLWGRVQEGWAAAGPGWQFWINWYEAALEGRPLLGGWDQHWDLLNEIALIAEGDWTAGPERVNGLITLLVEKHQLKAEAALLRAELLRREAVFASVEHRSHNQPPELVQAPIVHEFRLVIRALADVEEELAKPTPAPSVLTRIAETLQKWSKMAGIYCASLADIALKEAAKGVGITAAPGLTVWLLAQSESVQHLARALLDLAHKLPGGAP